MTRDLATGPGLEPGMTGPKPVVLPITPSGIGSAIYYPIPLHLQPCFADLGGAEGDLPVCEEWAGRVLALPIHPGVTSSQREEVVVAVAAFYS